ncbi:MAG TPA: hypothetical protein DEQ87_06470 [Algoriphagus sp.]|jgi:hypothetical protein|uniref:hypothetical protein n=1 Tax=unclassified Algoriphagus TaxID=2641541 RepID=UPI000C54793D|nr:MULTISPECIES: hypothetical protein [unclassified Algoriphagus]MAL13163.1 hypothetical protein [Algoriphagus sp.]MAL15348.1 hypothetical protein [Algoriphagus sp.]MAN86165.1 hypothetical protein [Algoriphagus sp.]HAH36542.1 hypothetical protein [Algoriphagus sp.]HAS58742.1 hypothetical protein [Algoriphagus sp.]|tara:strand:- start:3679 stop:4287 length:609 start_codon:yes stop_codon:yes gene_type:complete
MKSLKGNYSLIPPLCLLLIFLISSCIPNDIETVDPMNDPQLEYLEDSPFPNPLENLRMDPMTLSMLANLRAATAKYQKFDIAIDDGYIQGSGCVASPDGGMGYHFVNFPEVDGEFDPTQPEALLYEEQSNGRMRLVGVEFVIVADLWDLENEDIPYFGNQEFEEVQPPLPLPFRNYQLHVWVWKNNPEGIFEKWNPTVKCLD